MSRPLRIEWEGALYHVTSRGDRREAIVEDDVDRAAWVDVLSGTCGRFGWRLFAWCLMDNHYHLLVQTPRGNLLDGMRQLNGVWSQQFNWRHGRVGHVFQGRFKAIMVERESYLLELARYVVLNPLRAHMVAQAQDHVFGSYRQTVGLATLPVARAALEGIAEHCETQVLLAQFSARLQEARIRYADFVRAGVGQARVWAQLRGQVFLGSNAFLLHMQAKLADETRMRDGPFVQRQAGRSSLAKWAQRLPKLQAAVQAFANEHFRQRDLWQFFGVGAATTSV